MGSNIWQKMYLKLSIIVSSYCFAHSSTGEESSCNAGDICSIPGLGRSPGERIGYPLQYSCTSLVAQMVKNLPAMQDIYLCSIPGLGRFSGEGKSYPLQYSCLKNSMDRVAWQAIVRGVAKNWPQLGDFHFAFIYLLKSCQYNLHPDRHHCGLVYKSCPTLLCPHGQQSASLLCPRDLVSFKPSPHVCGLSNL